MENKIMLELISKNLEEIKFFFETMLKDENPDPLLIEITTLKAKALYQELKLLLPKESLVENNNRLVTVDELPVVEQINSEFSINEVKEEEFENQETTLNQAVVGINEIISEETIVEENTIVDDAKILSVIENELPSIEPVELVVPLQESITSPSLENDPGQIVPQKNFQETGSPTEIEEPIQETDSKPEPSDTDQEIIAETIIENQMSSVEPPVEVTLAEKEVEQFFVDEPVELIEMIAEAATEVHPVTDILIEEENSLQEEKKVFGEQFVKEPSLNEKLASVTIHELKIKAQPISNIKGTIGLNDRFLFTRELFGNDSAKFESAINQLDQSSTLLEAIEYLEKNFKWTKNDISLKFMDLVKRRFDN